MTDTPPHTLEVDLGARSYLIRIGADLISHPACYPADVVSTDVLIVTNEVVAPLYLDKLRAALGDRRVESLVLPDGEDQKHLATFGRIIDRLAGLEFHRDATLIALGGGVIGDLTGFAAACYQRGIPYVQVPTTLLAQVDAAVGGKTAVNHPAGKNLIGAFYQPRAVLADVASLDTLGEREYRAGLAEVIKYGAALDADFFAWLEQHLDALLARRHPVVADAVLRCCALKARIVEEDEREAGRRALLNLGHTFGHAIETAAGYGSWLHGEAVAVGMIMAADLSLRLGHLAAVDADRLRALVVRAGLPVAPPAIGAERMADLMTMDKKVTGGRLRLILLARLGEAFVAPGVDAGSLRETLSLADAG
jgi:3-dehydroquinate synthase